VELELVANDRLLEPETGLLAHSPALASSGGAPFHSVAPLGGVRPRCR
jgi:hypothetical protein